MDTEIFYYIATKFNELDEHINIIIAHYFSLEEKRSLFKKEFLKTNSFSKKLDLLKNINKKDELFKDYIIENIRNCSSIRNNIIHNNPNKNHEYSIVLDGKKHAGDISYFYKIYKDYYRECFRELNKLAKNYLKQEKLEKIIKNLAGITVHARNYKWWFVDIYDLEIEDEDGNEMSIDYPNYQFSIDFYDDEIQVAIKSYLSNKYGADTENAYVDVTLDWFEEPRD